MTHLYDLGLEKEPMDGIIDVDYVRSASVRDWMSKVRKFRERSTKGPSLMKVKEAIEKSLEYLAEDILEPGSKKKVLKRCMRYGSMRAWLYT